MAGTKVGGLKAAKTNKTKYGRDFYGRIGKLGGAKGRTGGFYANPELASEAGRKGGLKSRRQNYRHSEETRAKIRAAWAKRKAENWGFLEEPMSVELQRSWKDRLLRKLDG